MSRRYTAVLPSVARTVAFDAFEFTPADDKPICIHGIFIGQSTEIGDAQEEQITVEIQRGGTGMTSGSTGTGSVAAQAPVAIDPVDTTAGATYDAGNETVATFTGGVTLWRDTFNVRSGYQMIFPPEMRPECSQANGGIVVRLTTTPADSITWVGTCVIEEM
jgi:hypothetical protein